MWTTPFPVGKPVGVLVRVKGTLAALGGCAALDPPCALQLIATTGNGRNSHFVRGALAQTTAYCEALDLARAKCRSARGPILTSRSGPISPSGEDEDEDGHVTPLAALEALRQRLERRSV
jgi:hypothetical protein